MKFLLIFLIFAGIAGTAYAFHDDVSNRGADNPKIAVDGKNVFVVWRESTNPDYWDVYFAKSTDGGMTFSDPINLTKGSSFYPEPQIEGDGKNIYIVWEDRTNPDDGIDTIYFTKSNDLGNSFNEVISLDPFNEGKDVKYFFKSMLVSNDSLFVFVDLWDKKVPQQKQLAFISSDDHGNTFSEHTVIFDSNQFEDFVDVASDKSGAIYVLADDPKNYDEKGNLNFRKIFPDGRLGNVISVNGGNTAVTNSQLSVSQDNVYVVWRAWDDQRWFPMFAKSNDGGNTFEIPLNLKPDTDSIDTAWTNGRHLFSYGDSVHVVWPEEYWDGKTQTFQSFIASSKDGGHSFETTLAPLNDKLVMFGKLWTMQYQNELFIIAPTFKNPPYNEPALYLTKSSDGKSFSEVFDLLERNPPGFDAPDFAVNENGFQIVATGKYNEHCVLYLKSLENESYIRNLSEFGDNLKCLGITQKTPKPDHQTNTGVKPFEIQCDQDHSKGYLLALRSDDGNPVCIFASSYLKILERGWIQKDSGEELALQAAKDFVASSPTFLYDGIADSIDLKVSNTRKSIPPVVTIQGSFETNQAGYGDRTGQEFSNENQPHKKEIILEVAQVNKIHSAIIDDFWDEINQESSKEKIPDYSSWFRSGPTSQITLTFGEPINSKGLVPLYITELSENVTDQITFWQFQPTREDSAANRGKTWQTLPEDKIQRWEFTGPNGEDAWDDSVIPRDNFGITLEGHGYPVICGSERFEGSSYHPATIPIKPEIKTVIAKSGQIGYLPDPDGVYSIHYISLFDTFVDFPKVEIIEHKRELCLLEQTTKDSTHAYHTSVVFKINDYQVSSSVVADRPHSLPINVPSTPYDGAILGDAHEHASILVKIFNDKFDFAHPDYQIKSSWIHFEGLDGNTIHRHSKDVTLGYFFDTLGIGLSQDCYVFVDGREFCTNEEYSLKFLVNGNNVEDITEYVVSEGDRILISYGPENKEELKEQLEELIKQEMIT